VGLFVFFGHVVFAESAMTESLALQKAKDLKWFQDPQWLRLGQYQKQFLGGYQSPAESSKFFLAVDGKNNPESELYATIQDLFRNSKKIKSQDGRFEDPVACVFPARKLWLEKKIGQPLPKVSCDRYARFIEIMQPNSLTYVFSSYYMNNPASAFGHTFLRINKAPSARDGERYELSDYGVSYAAMKVSDNPFVYSFLGVSGLMPGTFEINPYYYKVREYNDFESRDLWEYDLDFTPVEVEMVVAYIWELLDVNFNYHYFSQNCSYRILSILETARPELNLTASLKSQVMPGDTVQTLYQQQGLVTQVHFRPSVRSIFDQRYQELNDTQKTQIRRFAKTESIDELVRNLDKDEQRKNLDAAMDYIDFRYPKEVMTKTGKYAFKKEILSRRAELGGQSAPIKVLAPVNEGPHEAHGSRRLGLGYREWNKENSYLLDFKLSLHDLLDRKFGYPPTAQITMGHFGVAWNSTAKNLSLDYATLYEVISLAPISDFSNSSSWRLKWSVEQGYESACRTLCRWTELSGGTGVSATVLSNLDLSAWLRVTTLTSPDFTEDQWRLGAGPAVLVRWSHKDVSLLAESYYRYDYKSKVHEFRKNSIGLNYTLSKSLSVRVQGEFVDQVHRSEARLLLYY